MLSRIMASGIELVENTYVNLVLAYLQTKLVSCQFSAYIVERIRYRCGTR